MQIWYSRNIISDRSFLHEFKRWDGSNVLFQTDAFELKKNYGNFVLRHSLQWNKHFRFRYILSEGTSQSLIKFSRTCGITPELHPCTEQFSITRDHSAHRVRSATYPSYDAKWISYHCTLIQINNLALTPLLKVMEYWALWNAFYECKITLTITAV